MGKSLEKHTAHDTEDRGVRADAQSERDDDDGRERGRVAQRSGGVFHVGDDALEPGKSALVADRLGRDGEAAGIEEGAPPGFIGGHAPADVLRRRHLQMGVELGAHVVVRGGAGIERPLHTAQRGAE
jgi:hypothetical protein